MIKKSKRWDDEWPWRVPCFSRRQREWPVLWSFGQIWVASYLCEQILLKKSPSQLFTSCLSYMISVEPHCNSLSTSVRIFTVWHSAGKKWTAILSKWIISVLLRHTDFCSFTMTRFEYSYYWYNMPCCMNIKRYYMFYFLQKFFFCFNSTLKVCFERNETWRMAR